MSFLDQPIGLSIFGVRVNRQIETIEVNVILQENSSDMLEITQQPVQQGAMISDHAFKKPTTLSMNILQKYNYSISLDKTFKIFLDLQSSRTPFDVVTPKRVYKNMLLQTLAQTTDKNTENCLALNLGFQEVIIVSTSTTTVPRKNQKNAARTGKTEKAGRKSVFLQGADAISQVFKVGGA